MDRDVSEAWFGRQLTRYPPASLRVCNGPVPPEPTRLAGMALIITGTVLLAVPISLPFLNVKLLGLIVIVAGLVKVRAPQRASSGCGGTGGCAPGRPSRPGWPGWR